MKDKGFPRRGDLVRAWVLHGSEALHAAAELQGFTHQPIKARKSKDVPNKNPIRLQGTSSSPDSLSSSDSVSEKPGPAPIQLLRPTSRSFREPTSSKSSPAKPPQIERITVQDLTPVEGAMRPRRRPIVPWSELWRALDQSLSLETAGRTIDLPRYLRGLARGDVVQRVPLERVRRPAGILLVLDRSRRLNALYEDRNDLRRRLKRAAGKYRFHLQYVDGPGDLMGDLDPGSLFLVVSDLGIYGSESTRRAWQDWAWETLNESNCRPRVLIPCPSAALHGVDLRPWKVLDWTSPNLAVPSRTFGPKETLRNPGLEHLQVMASMAMRLETGLIRDLCQVLPAGGLDLELQLRRRPLVVESSTVGLVLDPAKTRPLRHRFATLPRRLKLHCLDSLRHWHKSSFPEIWASEVLLFLSLGIGSDELEPEEGLSTKDFEDGEIEQALALIQKLSATSARLNSTEDGLESEIDGFVFRLGQWGSANQWQHSEVGEGIQAGFQRLMQRYPSLEPPVGVTCQMQEESKDLPIKSLDLFLRGNRLLARPSSVKRESQPYLATLAFRRPRILVSRADSRALPWDGIVGFDLDALGSGAGLVLVTDVETLVFEPSSQPSWATAFGQDEHGHWASFGVGTVTQKMRWIPPGRFLMGSPRDEEGRFGNEGPQREVALTEGFWMAETPCTKELWQAVMAENPRKLKGKAKPVERVKWEDCQEFFDRLNFQFRDFEFQLPTEAEWEFACRAGTQGPNWLGAHDSTNLAQIAWRKGNTSSTREVGELLPNPWGLHDILGNVWEWCWDWWGPYPSMDETDPEGPDKSKGRVLRGGSWYTHARSVRAAARVGSLPDYRWSYQGFRLSRGQSRGAQEPERVVPGPRGTRGRPRGRRSRAWVDRLGWASDGGTDRFGRWAAFEVKGVHQRLRWIYPGSFLMGSPDDEEGRWGDEGPQHKVTLTQGFWLGETPCTQGLWQAVMGENPSRFKSSDRPVEQVSWDDCHEFFARLKDFNEWLEFRLPTEAQWEYACRAATDEATWKGKMRILGERNAPILDSIAWYGGNSGVGFDLEEGVDSSDWKEKQYPHTQTGTRPVGLKQANPWGLHDMLGNVYEWCGDYWGGYSEDDAVDPVGPEEGTLRVIRGGSWDDRARLVRAACRFGHPSDARWESQGFRLSRGQSRGASVAERTQRPADEGRRGGKADSSSPRGGSKK